MTTWNHTKMKSFANNCFPALWVLADTCLLSGLIWVELPTLWAVKSIHILRQFLLFLLRYGYLLLTWTWRFQLSSLCYFPKNIQKKPQTNQSSSKKGSLTPLTLKVNSTSINDLPEIFSSWAPWETHSVWFYYCLKIFAILIYIAESNKTIHVQKDWGIYSYISLFVTRVDLSTWLCGGVYLTYRKPNIDFTWTLIAAYR